MIHSSAFHDNLSRVNANFSIFLEITPVDSSGNALTANTLTFSIIDECPASNSLSGGSHCDQCTTSEVYAPLSIFPN